MRCLLGLSLLNFGNPPPLITYAELFCQIPLQYVIDQEGAILSTEWRLSMFLFLTEIPSNLQWASQNALGALFTGTQGRTCLFPSI